MKRNNLDEMKELKLLKIEHKGLMIGFYGLVVLIVIESFITGFKDTSIVLDKVILVLIVGTYMVVSCVKEGIWDRNIDTSNRSVLLISLFLGLCGAGVLGYKAYVSGAGIIYSSVLGFIIGFVACSVLSILVRFIYNKRIDTLENGDDE